MPEKETRAWREAVEHGKASCRESRAMIRSLLPDTFWEHASASRKEAMLAVRALHRGVRRQFRRSPKRTAARQRIKIA